MATVKVRGEAVETHKMIKDNKLKRRSQEKKVSHPKEPGKLKTHELVNSKDCIFKRRDFHVLFFPDPDVRIAWTERTWDGT